MSLTSPTFAAGVSAPISRGHFLHPAEVGGTNFRFSIFFVVGKGGIERNIPPPKKWLLHICLVYIGKSYQPSFFRLTHNQQKTTWPWMPQHWPTKNFVRTPRDRMDKMNTYHNITHMINVWYIFTYIYHRNQQNVGNTTIPWILLG